MSVNAVSAHFSSRNIVTRYRKRTKGIITIHYQVCNASVRIWFSFASQARQGSECHTTVFHNYLHLL